MSTKSSIKLANIIKRSSAMKSCTESTADSDAIFKSLENLLSRETKNNAVIQQKIRSYIESMCNSDNATTYYYHPLSLLEYLNDSNDSANAALFMREYTSRIIPYTKDLSNISEALYRHTKLTEDQIFTISEAVNINITADRILSNHERISNRFNIENEAKRYNTVGLKYVVDSCAEMVDTYKVKNYQKFSITMEEVSYILDKNGFKYNRGELAKYCLEYFLSSNPYISDTDKNNYKKVLTESYIIEEDDCNNLYGLLSGNIATNISIQNTVDSYLVSPDKSTVDLNSMINKLLVDTSKEDIIYNIDKLIYLIWDLCKNKTFETDNDNELYRCMSTISDYIVDCTNSHYSAESTDKDFSKEDVLSIIDTLTKVKGYIASSSNCNTNYSTDAAEFIDKGLNPCINSLDAVSKLLYWKSNIDNINAINSCTESMVLNEFKVFKFHNLIRACFNLDKFLKVKEKRAVSNVKNKAAKIVSKAKNILFGEAADIENDIYSYIGEDCRADICVRQYPIKEADIEDVEKFLESVCCEYNDLLLSQGNDSIKVYYSIVPGLAEIRIKEATIVDLTEAELAEVRKNIDPSFESYIEYFAEADEFYKTVEGFSTTDISKELVNFSDYANFTMEHFELALEAMSYLDIDNNTVKIFGERFTDYNFNNALKAGSINESFVRLASKERYISEAIENRRIEVNMPPEIQLEAYSILLQIMEEAGKPKVGGAAIEQRLKDKGYYDDEDDDDEDDDDEDDEDEDDDDKKKDTNKSSEKKEEKDPEDVTKGMDPYKGKASKGKVNLTNIKLALKGLQTKVKDMDTKYKEASRNLDNAARAFIKSTRDALTNDRREAIIKGSLIPSFSRCIKASVVIAAIGFVSAPAALITAMGAIAVSKKLNDNERKLLLDEIETELEVIEKELQIADSNNDIKKYRALLQYKKDLQRQYQRIRYNIRIGKDLLPKASAGAPNKD